MRKAILFALLCAAPAWAGHHHGNIHRSSHRRAAFEHSHPCPWNGEKRGACYGFVVDHIVPLACGGADTPGNMQWQTTADARAKDKWERIPCR